MYFFESCVFFRCVCLEISESAFSSISGLHAKKVKDTGSRYLLQRGVPPLKTILPSSEVLLSSVRQRWNVE